MMCHPDRAHITEVLDELASKPAVCWPFTHRWVADEIYAHKTFGGRQRFVCSKCGLVKEKYL